MHFLKIQSFVYEKALIHESKSVKYFEYIFIQMSTIPVNFANNF